MYEYHVHRYQEQESVPLKLTIVFDQPINPAAADCSLPTNDSWLVPEPDEY